MAICSCTVYNLSSCTWRTWMPASWSSTALATGSWQTELHLGHIKVPSDPIQKTLLRTVAGLHFLFNQPTQVECGQKEALCPARRFRGTRHDACTQGAHNHRVSRWQAPHQMPGQGLKGPSGREYVASPSTGRVWDSVHPGLRACVFTVWAVSGGGSRYGERGAHSSEVYRGPVCTELGKLQGQV